jgi:hypothetical protein
MAILEKGLASAEPTPRRKETLEQREARAREPALPWETSSAADKRRHRERMRDFFEALAMTSPAFATKWRRATERERQRAIEVMLRRVHGG